MPEDRTERNLFAWSLLVSLVLFGAMAGPFLVGRIYTRDDLGATHLPFRAFYAEQLAHGEPFDWMPQLFSGFYLTGEGQAGTYHPLHWILYRLLPLQAALAGEYLATYPFMLAGFYLFLRRRLGRRDASMLGALAFTFSGFNLLHFAHPNAIAVVSHIPWLLWTIDIAMTDPNRQKVALAEVGIALLTGSELLLGYPQYVWFSLVAEGAWAGYLLLAQPEVLPCEDAVPGSAHRNSWYRVPIAKACGLLLGGVQLLPTIESLTHAARRSGDASFANWGSLHPGNLVQLIAPYMLTDRVLGENTHELGVYVGVVPLLL
ncbi:MAG TPA: hypothetical protein VE890_01790, partial [Thermoguttaceae bacterium]|nr:hypothetical protein [Thermoguttaceae bacterium]